MSKIKSRDYLFATGYVRSLERGFFTHERAERLIAAKDNDDVLSILGDCGYRDALSGAKDINAGLNEYRRALFADFKSFLPSENVINIIALKYDFHNIKSAVKCGGDFELAKSLMIDAGMYAPNRIIAAVPNGTAQLPAEISAMIVKASEIFTSTRDPQMTDFYLDRELFKLQYNMACEIKSDFLTGYVKLLGDISNLRSFARAEAIGRSHELLPNALTEVATVAPEKLMNISIEAVDTLYRGALQKAALAVSEKAPIGNIDLLCDDAVIEYLEKAKYINYGAEPAIAYLCIKDFEITQIRIILSGRAAGLSPDAIRERLRSFYV